MIKYLEHLIYDRVGNIDSSSEYIQYLFAGALGIALGVIIYYVASEAIRQIKE